MGIYFRQKGWIPEYRFNSKRRWRFDWALVARKVAIEIEGGVWTGGRHTSGAGFLKDCEKYNSAALMGWTVLRYTPKQIQDGAPLPDLEALGIL